MSRGAGRIQRALIDICERESDNAFTVEDLCDRIFSGNRIEKKHRVSVLRALRSLASETGKYRVLRSRHKGGGLILYDAWSLPSYSMARLKAHLFYRTTRYYAGLTAEEQEAKLRAETEPGGRHHRDVSEGGRWLEDVACEVAFRDGDHDTAARLRAKREREFEQWVGAMEELADTMRQRS